MIQLLTTGIQINEFMAPHHMVDMDWVWNDLCAGFLTVIIFEKFAYIHDFWIDANLKLRNLSFWPENAIVKNNAKNEIKYLSI